MREIFSSSTDPLEYLEFHGDPPDKRYLGIEIEVACNRYPGGHEGAAREFYSLLGRDFIIVKDEHCGIEIVSAPASLQVHRERWGRLRQWTRPGGLLAWTASSTGMHIHVSARAVRHPASLRRFISDPVNQSFVDLVAGRQANLWCARDTYEDYLQYGASGKYVAVADNICTLEVRIFRSSLNPDRILTNLEFVDALVEWLNREPPVPDYRMFVAQISSLRYPWLYRFLLRSGMTRPLLQPVGVWMATGSSLV